MSSEAEDMKKARRGHLSNEERQTESLEQIASSVGGIYRELEELNLALKATALDKRDGGLAL